MKNKILAVSLLSVFVFSFVVAGASAETRAEKKLRVAREKTEKKVVKRNTTATSTSSVGTGTSSSTSATTTDCMKTAIETRESAVISAQSAFSTSINSALETRKSALSSAWSRANQPAERKTAVKNAWEAFKTSSKTAVNTLRTGKKSAWTTFETAKKNCRGSSEAGDVEDNEGKGIDISVSN